MYKNFCFYGLIILATMAVACDGSDVSKPRGFSDSLEKAPDEAWKILSEKRIYFGHQSVGENIIAGIGDLQAIDRRIKLRISNLGTDSALKEPGFYHSPIGRNQDPKSKVDDFAGKMESGLGDSADIAFFKLCYIDMDLSTDVAALFAHYKNTMEALKNKYPRVTFVHVTMPLVSLQGDLKAWIKRIIGKPIYGREDNAKRDEYNRLLMAEYGGKDPVFDLASAESTFPNGTRSTFSKDGRDIPTLIPGYTYDSGHLNENGRQAAAAKLLLTLAFLKYL